MSVAIGLLTKRDAQLNLIWELSTTTKFGLKLSKQKVLDNNVENICQKMVSLVTKSSKLPLYAIARLMYGVVILYSKQVNYLWSDAQQTFSVVKVTFSSEVKETKGKKKSKRTRGEVDDDSDDDEIITFKHLKKLNDDLLDLPEVDVITCADARQITLVDTPLGSNFGNNFDLEDDLLPISDLDFNNLYGSAPFIEETFVDFRSSDQQKDLDNIRNESSFLDPFASDSQNTLNMIFSPLTTKSKELEANQPNRVPDIIPAPGFQDILKFGIDASPNRSNEAMNFENEMAVRRENSKSSSGSSSCYNSNAANLAREDSYKMVLQDIGSNDQNNNDCNSIILRTPNKKKRYDSQITKDEIRSMQDDYSSLLLPKDKILINEATVTKFTTKQLLDSSPYYIRKKRMAKALLDLYKFESPIRKFSTGLGTAVNLEEEEDSQLKYLGELELDDFKYFTSNIKLDFHEIEKQPIINDWEIEQPREFQMGPPMEPIEQQENEMLLTDYNTNDFSKFSNHLVNSPPPSVSSKTNEKYTKAEIRDQIIEACSEKIPHSITIDKLVSPSDTRVFAARTFYTILEMINKREITVDQIEPYGNIQINTVDDFQDIRSVC